MRKTKAILKGKIRRKKFNLLFSLCFLNLQDFLLFCQEHHLTPNDSIYRICYASKLKTLVLFTVSLEFLNFSVCQIKSPPYWALSFLPQFAFRFRFRSKISSPVDKFWTILTKSYITFWFQTPTIFKPYFNNVAFQENIFKREYFLWCRVK